MTMLPTQQPSSNMKRLRLKKLKKLTAFVRASFSSRRRIKIPPLPVLPTHQTSSTKRLHRTKLAAFLRVSLSGQSRRRTFRKIAAPLPVPKVQGDLEFLRQMANGKESFGPVTRSEKEDEMEDEMEDDIGNHDLTESQNFTMGGIEELYPGLGSHDGAHVETVRVDITDEWTHTDSKSSAHTGKKKWWHRLRGWWKSPSTVVVDDDDPLASPLVHNHTKSVKVDTIHGKYAECDNREIHTNVESAGVYNEAIIKVEKLEGNWSALCIGNGGHFTINYYTIEKGRPTMFYPVLVFMILSFYMQQEARGLSF
ncbi:hypothetical protein K435DRAFT_787383 [Dendrothele bispora CBS 962.96]|uniref:Uncharacterized protein n=1 Tax=Dendrothele bispora (strain CBS 962.96) TaxID=1314807 RepID=A0A4S8KKL3_DENBC|nr:hypothetical protein K435DRAFT_787383 [Dendrothele bispora CBS 962.96]